MEISIKANHDFLLQITLHDSYSPPINVASEKETPTSVYAVRSAAKITVFLTIFSLCEREKKNQKALMSLWVYRWHLKHLYWIL